MTQPGDGRLESLREDLQPLLGRILKQTGIPGISVALSARGDRCHVHAGVVEVGGSRPIDRQTRFDTGCVMKWLLAIVALELAKRGRLDLSAPIGEYLPELAASRRGKTVHVRHLLSHTSGYQGLDLMDPATRGLSWHDFVAYLDRARQFFSPGTVFNYEHSETAILSRVLERISSQAVKRSIGDIVLGPLNIGSRSFECGSNEAICARRHVYDRTSRAFLVSGAPVQSELWRRVFPGCTLTPDELVTIAEALMRAGSGDSPRSAALSAETLRQMQHPAVELPRCVGGPLSESMPRAFGTGAAILRGGILGNSGMSHGQCFGLRFDPRAQAAVAVGINAMLPHIRDLILNSVQGYLSGLGHGSADDSALTYDLAAFQGLYRGSGSQSVAAEIHGDSLDCAISSRYTRRPLRATVSVDEGGRLSLRCPAPHLVLGFFESRAGRETGLMLGLSAFKRVSPLA